MTRPSAPVLTADYYTYSTYSQREDFYGGIEPKNETNGARYNRNAGPTRMEPVICKNTSRKDLKEETASAHCFAFIYLAIATCILIFNFYILDYGIKNKIIYYISGGMGCIILTSIMMHIGIAKRQPFLCIPFVVFRTMETFLCFCFVAAFSYSLIEPNNDMFRFFVECTKFVTQLFPKHYNIDLVDETYQFCILGCIFSLAQLSVSIYVCRVSFECTMWVADQLRAKRIQKTYDSSRVRIASDEFYCT